MKKMTANEIRRTWLDFFVKNDHFELEPVSLIPINDPTLLWINSGVATLKNYFSGKENPPHVNLTNSQKAIRTNDIFNVGVTARHHTFFEMLGNFSVGGYFKEHAIELGYNFLVNELKIPLERLYFTVYEEDPIAYDKWVSMGVDPHHIMKCGRDRNFWDVGSGPCGPCTEIYFDRGEKYDPEHIGEKLFFEDIENDRYVEIWNIVFSEFNNDGNNNYTPLIRKNIDTGAGLERLACIMQDVPSNFETDLFIDIIREIEKYSDKKYDVDAFFKKDPTQNKINLAYKVIADHSRALVMAIADGAVPSNKERGYILRRLIRRIIVKQHYLNIQQNIFTTLVDAVIKVMSGYYKSLPEQRDRIISILDNEYNIFQKTLKLGFKLFNESLSQKKLDKNVVFKLVETYGFPIELIQELADENNVTIDLDGFNELFKKHQEISNGQKSAIAMEQQNAALLDLKVPSEFLYDTFEMNSKVVALFDDSFKPVETLENSGWVVFDKTCFYATSGGQLHDFGWIDHSMEVDDVVKGPNLQHLHHVTNINELKIGQECYLKIDKQKRLLITKNHSVEHLIHITLVKQVDSSIKQEGAFKSPEKVTFDFQYHEKMTEDKIKKLEDTINGIINKKVPVDVLFLSLEEAKKMGAMAYFEEVYKKIKGDLRVIKMGDESIELCGGCHVHNTNEIEEIMVTDCYPNGAGSWRLEAITSKQTIKDYINRKTDEINNRINEIEADLKKHKVSDAALTKLVANINKETNIRLKQAILKDIENEYIRIKGEIHKQVAKEQIALVKTQVAKNNDSLVIEAFKDLDNKNLFMALSELTNEQPEKTFVFLNHVDNKTQYLIATNEKQAASKKINLNEMIKKINAAFEGKGGGKPAFVQGGCAGTISVDQIKKVIA